MCNANCIIFGATTLNRSEVKGKRVVEVGSNDVNGSLRPILTQWTPAEYVGIDIEPGPGVDVICPAENMLERFGKESFDLVISTCVLEHIRNWREAVSNMKNVCKRNGILLIIVPSYWPFHAFPHDYWRFRKEDVENIFSDCDILLLKEDAKKPSLVYVKIRKPDDFLERDLSEYKLHSVILNKMIVDINDNEYNRSIHRLRLINNTKKKLSKLANNILSIMSKNGPK
jgi:SAM-dependent methyltransferase